VETGLFFDLATASTAEVGVSDAAKISCFNLENSSSDSDPSLRSRESNASASADDWPRFCFTPSPSCFSLGRLQPSNIFLDELDRLLVTFYAFFRCHLRLFRLDFRTEIHRCRSGAISLMPPDPVSYSRRPIFCGSQCLWFRREVLHGPPS